MDEEWFDDGGDWDDYEVFYELGDTPPPQDKEAGSNEPN